MQCPGVARFATIRGMQGTDANTGKPLDGIDHLRQSVREILTTPLGSRVLRRDFGSRLFELVDAPTNLSLRADIIAATSDALGTWEPRLAVESVEVSLPAPGVVLISVTGEYLPSGQAVTIEGIEVR